MMHNLFRFNRVHLFLSRLRYIVVYCKTNTDITFDVRSRVLVFVIRVSQSMQSSKGQIVQAARNITDFYANYHSTYLQAFLVFTYVNGSMCAAFHALID
jgi:hypothetical protein